MGLSVHVEFGEDSSHSLDLTYGGYSQFRTALVRLLCGPAYAAIYAAKGQMQVMSMPGIDLTPAMAMMISPDLARSLQMSKRPYPPSLLKAKDQASLELFIEHCDCDGEFSTSECKKIAKLFKQNRSKIKDLPKDTQRVYKAFLKAFRTAAKGKGKVVYG